jgi:serpin B
MKIKILVTLFLLLAVSFGCKKENPQPTVKEPVILELPSKADEVIQNSNGFGVDLFRLVSEAEDKNLMLSPLSASTALNMLLNGCETETYGQIRDMLGYEGLTQAEINEVYRSLVSQLLSVDPEVSLALANAVWYRDGFEVKQSYFDVMEDVFDSHIEGLDFDHPSALETMNQWASDNTNGKIPKVLDEINPLSVMFLMNALYFKGTWTYQFDESNTSNQEFYLDDGSSVPVPLMMGNLPVKTHSGEGYWAAELFYGQQNFSMIVMLPANSLDEMIGSLDGEVWQELTTALDNIPQASKKDVFLPKFKFEFEKRLNDQLRALGMVDAFDPLLADLSGIADTDIYVSFVKQNTFVEVNEEGTEAAAVTTVGIEYTSIDEFRADRPFLFAIRERTTNSLLFIGKVIDPTE